MYAPGRLLTISITLFWNHISHSTTGMHQGKPTYKPMLKYNISVVKGMATRLVKALYVAMLWKYRRVKGRVASCAEMEIAKLLSTNRGSRGRCLQFSVAGMPRMIIPSMAAQESWKPMSHNEAGSVSSTIAALTFRISIWLRLSPHTCSNKANDVISAARMRLLGQPVITAYDHSSIIMPQNAGHFHRVYARFCITILKALYSMPRCMPDRASRWEAPASRYSSFVSGVRNSLLPSVSATICPKDSWLRFMLATLS